LATVVIGEDSLGATVEYQVLGFWRGGLANCDTEAIGTQIDSLALHAQSEPDPALDVRGEVTFQIYDVPRRSAPLGALCHKPHLIETARKLLGDEPIVAWALMLNKAQGGEVNWSVPWHQDTSVYCIEAPDGVVGELRGGFATFRPQDNTAGQLVAARVAIDPDTLQSGCLFVIPGSHRYGNLWPEGHARFAGQIGEPIELQAGEVLFFNPLLMHRADQSDDSTRQRRVVHIYYRPASLLLPKGARWIDWS
jgi:ectoine hydroxylase-related dioxygenase (phytanoyl-CoA dioxygenase family)